MKDFSSHFLLIAPSLLSGVTSLSGVTYIPTGSVNIACIGKVSLTQTLQNDERGPVWQISFRAATLDDTVKAYHASETYVGILMTDGTVRILGELTEIPRLEVTRYPGAYVVTCSYESAEQVAL